MPSADLLDELQRRIDELLARQKAKEKARMYHLDFNHKITLELPQVCKVVFEDSGPVCYEYGPLLNQDRSFDTIETTTLGGSCLHIYTTMTQYGYRKVAHL